MRNKRGAMELSISTLVVIILAMSMLILGLILIKTIFTSSIDNITSINDKVKKEIDKLFVEEAKAVIYLSGNQITIAQGKPWGIGFGIQNMEKTQQFSWEVVLDDADVQTKCGVTKEVAEGWIDTGRTGTVPLSSGEKYYDLITFNIAKGEVSDISKCNLRYQLRIKKEDTNPYQTVAFIVKVSN